MSQHIFPTKYQGKDVVVVLGWDRPLQHFFMTIEKKTSRGTVSFLYHNLDDVVNTLEHYREVLVKLGIDVPEKMFVEALCDGDLNMGNRIEFYASPGASIEQILDEKNARPKPGM
jgi:hypothetical protein